MNLFAKGSKNNPDKQAQKEQKDFQAWQQAQNEKLAKEQEKYLAQRIALMATMSKEEWEEYLQNEARENAKEFSDIKEYEKR